MKTKTLVQIIALLSLADSFTQAAPMGTAFTYQGHLAEGVNPANGVYDFTFALYSQASGGTALDIPRTNNAVAVSNGLFTVTLDFGAGAFVDEARWLEIAVCTNGSGSFSPLQPRQQLTPTPCAIFSANAGAASHATSATTVLADGVSTTSLQGNAVTTDKIADGTITGGDLDATVRSNTFWRLDGNAGTTPGAHFLGTTDPQPLEMKVAGTRVLRLEPGAESPNILAGHAANLISAGVNGAVIGGGGIASGSNAVMGRFGTISGGVGNVISTNAGDTTIGGGWLNVILPFSGYTTIGGGSHNIASNIFTTIAGGYGNAAIGDGAVVGGGYSNSVGALRGAIVGGSLNRLEDGTEGGFIGSGFHNHIAGDNSSIAGGFENSILALVDGFIGGGLQNQVSESQSVIGGGHRNTNASYRATIAGGSYNYVQPGYAGGFIGSGVNNRLAGHNSVIGGGYENNITNLSEGVVGGGFRNQLSANHAVIGGGLDNTNAGPGATIGGGNGNKVSAAGYDAVIAGGYQSRVEASSSTIAGGRNNLIRSNSSYATIAGGLGNAIGVESDSATVGGGEYGRIGDNSRYAVIAGGRNHILGSNSPSSTISGGSDNEIPDYAAFATIPGGSFNFATNYALAAGRQAKARHQGAFVWADSQDADFASSATNQFLIRAAGNVGINTNAPQTALHVAGAITADAFLGSGAGLTSLSGAALAPSSVSNVALAPDAVTGSKIANGSIQPADLNVGSFSTTFWRTDGNEGTRADLHFLGTTDNEPLEIRVSGGRALRFEDNGDGSDGGTLPDGAPNLVGGSEVNYADKGVVGATIAGGGAKDFGGVGCRNSVASDYGTVNGGLANQVDSGAFASVISGGSSNRVSTRLSAIGGGWNNRIENGSEASTIAGGTSSTISSNSIDCSIGGGNGHAIDAQSAYATIAGGLSNDIGLESDSASVGGGENSEIGHHSRYATIAGGRRQVIGTNCPSSTIGGGSDNMVTNNATFATIPGGSANLATNYAFAAGRRAKAYHQGAYVWGDSNNSDIASTNANSVTMRASGGYRLFTGTDTNGVHLASGSGTWTSMSDRNAKEAFRPVNGLEVLDKVALMPLTTWNYKSQDAAIRHIGPMAQDFKAAFGVGETDTGISTVDADGVALAAIQGLNLKMEEERQRSETRMQKLEAENAELKQVLAEMKELIQHLAH